MNKVLLAGVGCAAFAAGFWVAANHYGEEVAEIKAAYAQSAQAAQEKYDAELMQMSARLSATIAERDQKIAALGATERERDALAGRMQQLAADSHSVPGTDSDPCKPVRTELASCVGLLSEGSRLRKEGAELLGKCASNLDAIKNLK